MARARLVNAKEFVRAALTAHAPRAAPPTLPRNTSASSRFQPPAYLEVARAGDASRAKESWKSASSSRRWARDAQGAASKARPAAHTPRVLLAIDYGEAKCGVALCDYDADRFRDLKALRTRQPLAAIQAGAAGGAETHQGSARYAAPANEADPEARAHAGLLQSISSLVRKHGVTGIVVGVPLGGPGDTSAARARTARFLRILCGFEGLAVPVTVADETGSSAEARRQLRLEVGERRAASRGPHAAGRWKRHAGDGKSVTLGEGATRRVDGVAARVFLESFVARLRALDAASQREQGAGSAQRQAAAEGHFRHDGHASDGPDHPPLDSSPESDGGTPLAQWAAMSMPDGPATSRGRARGKGRGPAGIDPLLEEDFDPDRGFDGGAARASSAAAELGSWGSEADSMDDDYGRASGDTSESDEALFPARLVPTSAVSPERRSDRVKDLKRVKSKARTMESRRARGEGTAPSEALQRAIGVGRAVSSRALPANPLQDIVHAAADAAAEAASDDSAFAGLGAFGSAGRVSGQSSPSPYLGAGVDVSFADVAARKRRGALSRELPVVDAGLWDLTKQSASATGDRAGGVGGARDAGLGRRAGGEGGQLKASGGAAGADAASGRAALGGANGGPAGEAWRGGHGHGDGAGHGAGANGSVGTDAGGDGPGGASHRQASQKHRRSVAPGATPGSLADHPSSEGRPAERSPARQSRRAMLLGGAGWLRSSVGERSVGAAIRAADRKFLEAQAAAAGEGAAADGAPGRGAAEAVAALGPGAHGQPADAVAESSPDADASGMDSAERRRVRARVREVAAQLAAEAEAGGSESDAGGGAGGFPGSQSMTAGELEDASIEELMQQAGLVSGPGGQGTAADRIARDILADMGMAPDTTDSDLEGWGDATEEEDGETRGSEEAGEWSDDVGVGADVLHGVEFAAASGSSAWASLAGAVSSSLRGGSRTPITSPPPQEKPFRPGDAPRAPRSLPHAEVYEQWAETARASEGDADGAAPDGSRPARDGESFEAQFQRTGRSVVDSIVGADADEEEQRIRAAASQRREAMTVDEEGNVFSPFATTPAARRTQGRRRRRPARQTPPPLAADDVPDDRA